MNSAYETYHTRILFSERSVRMLAYSILAYAYPRALTEGMLSVKVCVHGDLAVPVTRTVRYGPRSFAVAGPSTWNSLPVSLRSCHLPSSFRRDLKTELFISMPIISTLVTVYNVRAGEHNSSTHHHHHPTRFRHQCVRQAATYRVVSMKLGDREDSV